MICRDDLLRQPSTKKGSFQELPGLESNLQAKEAGKETEDVNAYGSANKRGTKVGTISDLVCNVPKSLINQWF